MDLLEADLGSWCACEYGHFLYHFTCPTLGSPFSNSLRAICTVLLDPRDPLLQSERTHLSSRQTSTPPLLFVIPGWRSSRRSRHLCEDLVQDEPASSLHLDCIWGTLDQADLSRAGKEQIEYLQRLPLRKMAGVKARIWP